MTRTRCHKFDFRKRLAGMFFHAAPAFNFEGHGRLALSANSHRETGTSVYVCARFHERRLQ
jgi:hypothetical protein